MTNIIQGFLSKTLKKTWRNFINRLLIIVDSTVNGYKHMYKHFNTYYALDEHNKKEVPNENKIEKEGSNLSETELIDRVIINNTSNSENVDTYTDVFQYRLKSKCAQLPEVDSNEETILNELLQLKKVDFQQVVTALFYEMKETKYAINKIGPAGANGFSFYGSLEVGSQLSYAINFVGEARQAKVDEPIDAKHVCRVLSMLNGGEYGFYITTSFYTESAQIEVLKERNSLKIIDGKQLVHLFKELNLARENKINELWLKRVLQGKQLCA
ncbi:hypothetical protein CIB95_10820 [Lottiidibacillus patelloidae]|uniref:Restriction endonuclease type IV Mrr domain-containing protein n=1 Tax=Lottiidibacillus patelloidae TaxID=2670334 RepID=A0A263BU51_9BACI|nr:restriction endonuclease [Lottiidibacillus patelloidae]OZM56706.1 hypothetical protein CIB95_10820 [Lottiidibacillus patelloidae]